MGNNSGPVVVYRLGSLGDTVVALPCLHQIRRSFPDRERIALTNFPVNAKASALGAVLGDSGLITGSIAYPVGLRSFAGLIKLRRDLRALGSDTLIYLTPPRGRIAAIRDVLFFRFCGFSSIIGVPTTNDLQKNRIDCQGNLEQEFMRLARCLKTLGPVDTESRSAWDIMISDAERMSARALLQPMSGQKFFAINMGGKVAKNDWGADNWKELIKRLAASMKGSGLLILGGAEDSDRARLMGDIWSGPVVDACGRVSPRVSGAAAANAAFFVGHDSGPLHLSACMGVTCIGLFGDNNPPRKWHPPGNQHKILHNMKGVMAITVDEVMAAVAAVRRAQAPGPTNGTDV